MGHEISKLEDTLTGIEHVSDVTPGIAKRLTDYNTP